MKLYEKAKPHQLPPIMGKTWRLCQKSRKSKRTPFTPIVLCNEKPRYSQIRQATHCICNLLFSVPH